MQFLTYLGIGGTERHVVNLVKRLEPSRFELHVACMRRGGEFLEELLRAGIPVQEYRPGSLYSTRALKECLRLALSMRRKGIRIAHSYGFYSNVFAIPAARIAGVPLIVASIRDTGETLGRLQKQAQRIACRLAHRILVNADAVRQWLVSQGYEAQKIVVIKNGVDFSRITHPLRAADLRPELGLPSGAPLVLVLSRLNPLKGIEYLLDSAVHVLRRFPEARFVIVGDGEHKAELERYSHRLSLGGRVIFTGFRTDVGAILAQATVSVLPSLSEGLSNTLLESMAAGVPVVATRVGGTPEAVEDERTGLLVPPRDSAALAHAVCRLLESPALSDALGHAGKRSVTVKFSIGRMVRETEDFYNGLLEGAEIVRQRAAA